MNRLGSATLLLITAATLGMWAGRTGTQDAQNKWGVMMVFLFILWLWTFWMHRERE